MSTLGFLIPAYCPDDALPGLVSDLLSRGQGPVLVVDDGSSVDSQMVFASLSDIEGVTLVRHAVNQGKGAAIKTGIQWFLEQHPDLQGIVTLDADGQHRLGDVDQIVERMTASPAAFVLGTRAFDGKVPFRSRFGNGLTRWAFRMAMGQGISDTQTGLRGLPLDFARQLLRIPSDRYEFELDMLIEACARKLEILEQPIQTVYIADNASSHFRPLRDSLRIYRILFRFLAVALASAFVDFTLFAIVHHFSGHILLSQVIARSVSIVFNYLLVRRRVFTSSVAHRRAFPKYLILAIGSASFAYGMIRFFHWIGVPVLLAKLIAELLAFFVNYLVQRGWVFSQVRRLDA